MQSQLRAVGGLARSSGSSTCWSYSTSPCESCGGSITGRRRDLSVTLVTYAVVPPSIRGQSRLALPGNQEPLLPRGIGSVGAEGVAWGRTAVVLSARESRAHGEGR